MTQKNVETVIGRLVSDEDLRALFRNNRGAALARLRREGLELNGVEAEALASLDPDELARLGRALDPRLQRACLETRRSGAFSLGALCILLQLGGGAAAAEREPARAPLRLAFVADREAARDSSRAGAPLSVLGWHRETQGRAQPLGLLTLRVPSRGRGDRR